MTPTILAKLYRANTAHQETSQFKFSFDESSSVKRDIKDKYNHESELLEYFANNTGVVVHKWHHYIPLYDRYFSPYRNKQIRFLEIGVSNGGSLQMWRNYFGADAIIFGIDIDPKCEKLNGLSGQVRIGSQTDPSFLASIVSEMGGLDIVLDDGSHHMEHITTSLKYLFPRLEYGGIYMIEDLHSAYWNRYGGGFRSRKNFFGFAMDLIDDMHYWYHTKKLKQAAVSKDCSGIHIHDSIVVLEKNKLFKPVHSRVGEDG
ncbi:class I SAM-dependent methyltransferase [Cyanobium sp. ULC082]